MGSQFCLYHPAFFDHKLPILPKTEKPPNLPKPEWVNSCTLPEWVNSCTLPERVNSCTLPEWVNSCTLPEWVNSCTPRIYGVAIRSKVRLKNGVAIRSNEPKIKIFFVL